MDDFYNNLARKAMSGAALFLNKKNEILILKPSYKDNWLLPGGISELYENPWQACVREVKEEISLDILEEKRLLSVAYSFSKERKREYINFIFYGGVLDNEQIKNIKVDGDEIVEYKFVKIEKIKNFLTERAVEIVLGSIKALKNNKITYLDQ